MKNTPSEFSRKLRDLRLNGKYKYTQVILGRLAGVTPSYISQLETGKKNPTPKIIRKLSPHLGMEKPTTGRRIKPRNVLIYEYS